MKNLILLTSIIFLSNNAFSQETSCNLMISKYTKLVYDGVKEATSDEKFTKRMTNVLASIETWEELAKKALQMAYDNGDMEQYYRLLDIMVKDTKPTLDWYAKIYNGKHEMRFKFTPDSNGKIHSYFYADLEMKNTNGLIDNKLFFDLNTEMPVRIQTQTNGTDIYSHYDSYESYVLSIKEVKDACIGEQFLTLKSQSKKGKEFYTGKTAYTFHFTREIISQEKR